jgi:hypothetical protein
MSPVQLPEALRPLASRIGAVVNSPARGFVAGAGCGLLAGVLLTAAGAAGDDPPVGAGRGAGPRPPVVVAPQPAPATQGTLTDPPTLTATDGGSDAGGSGSDGGGSGSTPADPVLTPPLVASALPARRTVTCPTATKEVNDAAGLTAALAAAAPGDVIRLADGTYSGAFVASRSGTAERPIWLCGGRGAVLDGDGTSGGYVLHLNGVASWRVVGITLTNGQKGLVADATALSVLQDLHVHDIGDEAIHLRATSTGNAVLRNRVERTGLRKPKFGEGIYVGSATSNWGKYSHDQPDRSDHNLVMGNTITQTSAESVDIKEGTTGGALLDNTFDGSAMTGADSWVDVKGNGWLVAGNTGRTSPQDGFQTHQIEDGWGDRNVFRDNASTGVPGAAIALAPRLGNVVACGNTGPGEAVLAAARGC